MSGSGSVSSTRRVLPRNEGTPAGLDALLRGRDLWRMGKLPRSSAPGISTGFEALDERLPDRGWPVGALSEVLVRTLGSCELALVLPALTTLTRAGREVALVGPAHLPYAPGLAGRGVDLGRVLVVQGASGEEHAWAAEQSLRSGACAAVALWSHRLDARTVRVCSSRRRREGVRLVVSHPRSVGRSLARAGAPRGRAEPAGGEGRGAEVPGGAFRFRLRSGARMKGALWRSPAVPFSGARRPFAGASSTRPPLVRLWMGLFFPRLPLEAWGRDVAPRPRRRSRWYPTGARIPRCWQ